MMNETPKKPEPEDSTTEDSKPAAPNFLQVMMSVFAAAFGVQSDKNYQRDFSTGNPLAYIIGGLIFTVLFIMTLVSIVMLVLP